MRTLFMTFVGSLALAFGCIAVDAGGRVVQPNDRIDVASQINKDSDIKPIATIKENVVGTTCLAFTPDSKNLAAYNRQDGRVRFWKATTGKQLADLTIGDPEGSGVISISPSGSILAATIYGGQKDLLCLWDWEKKRELARVEGMNTPRALAFDTDGKMLAVVDNEHIYLFGIEKRKTVHKLPHKDGGALSCVAFSPDGKKLAVSGAVFQRLHIFDCERGVEEKLLEVKLDSDMGSFWSVHWMKDGKTIMAVGMKHGISYWDVFSGKKTRQFTAPLKDLNNRVAVSPDEQIIAAQTVRGDMFLWDLANSKQAMFVDSQFPTFSPNGKLLAIASSSAVRVWDFADFKKAAFDR